MALSTRLTLGSPLVLAALGLFGCDFVRSANAPLPIYVATAEPTPRPCLLVLLPGLGDTSDELVAHGFADAARGQDHCDLALVDTPFVHFREQNIEERLAKDVLIEARKHGYREVWLVGFSLGAYGAILTARAHPELVDGLVLVSPMLGIPGRTRPLLDEIEARGGLHAWNAPDLRVRPRHHFREPALVWGFLKEATEGDERVELYLAYGDDDRFSWKHDVLAEALPEDHVLRVHGGHDLATFRALFARVVERAPWDDPSRRRVEAASRVTSDPVGPELTATTFELDFEGRARMQFFD